MKVLLDFPELVKSYAPYFEDCFTPEGYEHFKRMLSGFMVGSNHTLTGITNMFAGNAPNQSSLNRFVNRQNFCPDEINRRRVEIMQFDAVTQIKAEGCISVDGSLLHHWGSRFDNIYNLWDHVTKSYGMAHELVTLYYADDQIDYPVDYELWMPPDWDRVVDHMRKLQLPFSEEKWEQRDKKRKEWVNHIGSRYRYRVKKHPQLRQTYETKVHISERLIRKFVADYPDRHLPVVVDSGFASSEFFTVLHEGLKLDYVADIKAERAISVKAEQFLQAGEFVARLNADHNTVTATNPEGKAVFKKVGYRYRGKKKAAYVYTGVHRLKNHPRRHKIIIHYNHEELKGEPRITVTNRINWSPSKILYLRRLRWPVETYHQQAKSQGLESYQVRNESAIASYIAFVMVAFTMMTKATRDEALLEQLQQRIQSEADRTLPFIRRLLQSGAMWTIAEYIYLAAQKGQPLEDVMKPMLKAMTLA
jgi:hypothetical protein